MRGRTDQGVLQNTDENIHEVAESSGRRNRSDTVHRRILIQAVQQEGKSQTSVKVKQIKKISVGDISSELLTPYQGELEPEVKDKNASRLAFF